jgi:gas vesicle protein
MSKNPRQDLRAFRAGAIWGALLAAFWMLFNAPRSGEEMRNLLRRHSTDALNNTRRQLNGQSVEEALQEGKEKARQLNQRAQKERG